MDDFLAAYDVVSKLYPLITSMYAWRSCEYAGYRRFQLHEPVLDLGCGDGRFFRLLWPEIKTVDGVDFDAATAEAARHSGVYREVHASPADKMPVRESAYASAFANCSLEHMNNLPGVLNAIARNLKPGAPFILSVVTDKFIEWQMLSLLVEKSGAPDLARRLKQEHIDYHNLVNAFSADDWAKKLGAAGFEVDAYIPIASENMSRLILLFDQLWATCRSPAANSAYRFTRISSVSPISRRHSGTFCAAFSNWTKPRPASAAAFSRRRENEFKPFIRRGEMLVRQHRVDTVRPGVSSLRALRNARRPRHGRPGNLHRQRRRRGFVRP